MTDLHWFAVWLGEPKVEMAAEDAIKALGLQSFTPIEWKMTQRNPRNSRHKLKVRKAYPLLLRYGLVGFPRGARWADLLTFNEEGQKVIRNTRIGAKPVGMTPTAPTRLTDEQIESLASLSRYSIPYASAVNFHKASLVPNIGSSARIIDGALFGHVGRVDHIAANKARLVISMFGAMRPVEVGLDQLEAA